MPLKINIRPACYALTDYITTAIAWVVFYFVRKHILKESINIDLSFWFSLFLIPTGWLILYGILGSYNSIYKKSRLTELTKTFFCSLFGCVIIFFSIKPNDVKNDYGYYYTAFSWLLGLNLILQLT